MRFPGRIFLGGPWAQVFDLLTDLREQVKALEEKIDQMATSQADFDATLTTFETVVTAALTEIQTAINNIIAKVPPGVDLTSEVARLTAVQNALQTQADAIKALDTPVPPPTPTP